MRVHPHIPVGEIAASMPHVTKLLDVLGVDYVLHGKLAFRDACAEAGVDPAVVKASIEALPKAEGERAGWADASTSELLEELRERRHPKMRVMLAELATLLGEAPAGEPGLGGIREAFTALYLEVEPHLLHEEHVVFPAVRDLDERWSASRGRVPEAAGDLAAPIGSLFEEHTSIVHLLRSLREAAALLRDDDGMCTRMLDAVGELIHELREHIHIENNVLFPRALAIEEAVRSSGGR